MMLLVACEEGKPDSGDPDPGTDTGTETDTETETDTDTDCTLQVWYADTDADGYGDDAVTLEACAQPSGHVAVSGDCDDTRASDYPGAAEVCDGADNNCDGTIDEGVLSTFYADTDGDGFGDIDTPTEACAASSGIVADDTDCDDTNSGVNPGAAEACDELDNNCDGVVDEGVTSTFYTDWDGDGFGDPDLPVEACAASSGIVADDTDCDDMDGDIHPDADEVCDGVDNNCDSSTDGSDAVDAGTWYTDSDGDGYGSSVVRACAMPSGVSEASGDCDDADSTRSPGEVEDCEDGAENDCDGLVDCEDGDCTGVESCIETDCEDGVDNDSDGVEDCIDDDCWGVSSCLDPEVSTVTVRGGTFFRERRPYGGGGVRSYEVGVVSMYGSVYGLNGSSSWETCTWTGGSWDQVIRFTFTGSSTFTPSLRDVDVSSGCGLAVDGDFIPQPFKVGSDNVVNALGWYSSPFTSGVSYYMPFISADSSPRSSASGGYYPIKYYDIFANDFTPVP